MKNVKLYEEFIEEGIGDAVKNVAKNVGKKIANSIAKKTGLDKLKSLAKKTSNLAKRSDAVSNKAAKAKQDKTPEGNLEVSLATNQAQQIKIDSQKIKLQQAEVKIKQQIQKVKELEAQQKQIQQNKKQQKQEATPTPKKESIEIKQRVKLFEDFVNEFEIPSNRWIEMDLKKIDKEGMQQIWDMYTKTYLDAGMDLSADDWEEMQAKYKATALKDVDSDHQADAFIIYKPTRWGNKIALLGTNGKKEAKSDIVKKLLQLVNTKGWFIEASLRMEELLSQAKAPVITDKEMIEDVVGLDKKPEFTENGYYTRFLSKAGKRITKRIYGKLK